MNKRTKGDPLAQFFQGTKSRGAAAKVVEIPGGRLSFVEMTDTGACYIFVDKAFAIGVNREILENMRTHNLVDIGGGLVRSEIDQAKASLVLTREEADFIMGHVRSGIDSVMDRSFASGNVTSLAERRAARASGKGKVAASPATASSKRTAPAAKAATGRAGKTASAKPAPAKAGKTATVASGKGKGATGAASAPSSARKPIPAKAASPGSKSKGAARKATAPLKKAARSAAVDQRVVEKTPTTTTSTARRTGGTGSVRAGKATTKTAARSPARGHSGDGYASVMESKAAARAVILKRNEPVPRKELLEAVQTHLGKKVPGKDPLENLATMLYKDKDGGFRNIKRRGFWLTDRAEPSAS